MRKTGPLLRKDPLSALDELWVRTPRGRGEQDIEHRGKWWSLTAGRGVRTPLRIALHLLQRLNRRPHQIASISEVAMFALIVRDDSIDVRVHGATKPGQLTRRPAFSRIITATAVRLIPSTSHATTHPLNR
jgi:hypothetical protein